MMHSISDECDFSVRIDPDVIISVLATDAVAQCLYEDCHEMSSAMILASTNPAHDKIANMMMPERYVPTVGFPDAL